MDFLEEIKTLVLEHWAWGAFGLGLFFLLILALRMRWGGGNLKKTVRK